MWDPVPPTPSDHSLVYRPECKLHRVRNFCLSTSASAEPSSVPDTKQLLSKSLLKE